MTIKETYLKMLMNKHLLKDGVTDAGWSNRLEYFILNVLNGIKILNKKDLTMKEFSNLDYMIELTKESNNNEMRDIYLNIPGMKEDFSYKPATAQQYMFIAMTGKYYSEKSHCIKLKEDEYDFRFKVDVKSFSIKMTYGYESIFSKDIHHLIKVKDFIVENDIKSNTLFNSVKQIFGLSPKINLLEDVSEQVKIINY